MKRILVNDRCLRRPGAGVAGYLRCLLQHWPAGCGLELEGFCGLAATGTAGRTAQEPAGPVEVHLRPLSRLGEARRLSLRMPHWGRRVVQGAYGLAFSAKFRRGRYVAAFEPNHIACPCRGPVVTAMMDLSLADHPEWHPRDRVAWWNTGLARTVAVTTRWLAISHFTRDRMVARLGIDPAHIKVSPLAGRPLPYPTAEAVPRLRREAGLPERYLLHLGTLEPRKNLPVLLDAYAGLPEAIRRGAKLVFAGDVGWGGPEFRRRLMEHPLAGEVLSTGRVSDAAAALLLAGAQAVVVPSSYEGFGLPVLEAMACGVPVVCSDAAALRETAGNAAEVVGASDAASWSAVLRKALEDAAWRARLSAAGKERAAQFTWNRTASIHAEVLAGVCGAPSL